MATKLFKSNLLSVGVISAISAAGLLFGGLEAKAQTTDSNQMNQMDQNQMTQPNQNNPTPAAPSAPSTVQPSQNITPSTPSTPSTTTTSPTNTTSPIGQYSPNQAPLLTVGSQGQAVRDVQAFLNQQNLYPNAPDGIYGPQTQAAVRRFQESQNLSVDGIIGPQTWGAMLNSGNLGSSGQAQ